MELLIVLGFFIVVSWPCWFMAGYSKGKTDGLREARDMLRSTRNRGN